MRHRREVGVNASQPGPRGASAPPSAAAGTRTIRFRVRGMDCAEEVSILRTALASIASGDDLSFDILTRRMTVQLPADTIGGVEAVRRRVLATGMRAEEWGSAVEERSGLVTDRARRILCALSGLLIVLGTTLHGWTHGFLHALAPDGELSPVPLGALVVYAGAIVTGAWFVLPKAWASLKRLRPDMNLLMVIAIVGAILIGEWFEAAVVAFLFSLALLLESWSVDRARRAIQGLLDLSPPTARVRETNGTGAREVPIEEVSPGTIFSVRPGERVPLDGVIVRGESHLDEASLTGESTPVGKGPDDDVYAGTINADVALEIRATRRANDSTMARIIHMVEEAQTRRAPSERWVERFALRYTPIMLGLAVLVAIAPPLAGLASWETSIYRALVMLVIACPCALVISTPVSIVAALAAAARGGVLIKGGTFLEAAARVRALAVDKTGTLTGGEPVVEEMEPLEGHTADEILGCASALESCSNHPLARAILTFSKSMGVHAAPAESLRELPGRGAEGMIDGRRFWIGGHRLVHERAVETEATHMIIDAIESRGLTAVVLGTDEHVCGVLGLADAVRPEARGIVAALHGLGVERVVMLTGDHRVAAERVARATGVDEVHAGLLPQDKVAAIETLNQAHGLVAMVGDGVNDAPALATAGIGIAMGAAGSDVAIETADIALMSDDLARVPWLIAHARRTMRILRQNVALALGLKVLVMALAMLGFASLWMAIAADMGASLVVIANALRLLRE